MRVTTRASRAKNGTRRAGLGAKLLGVGVTTAVAIGISASPAAAAAVNPVFVPGNPPLVCPAGAEGFTIDPPVDTTVPVTVDSASGDVIVDFSEDLLQVSFNTTGNLAIRQVTVKGADDANRYIYDANSTPQSFPNGIAADTGLVAPINMGGNPPEISNVDFCVIPGDGS
ncbi:hypothetical protein ACIBAG_22970 [Streptomyces sp. NPDC051243]|uniref:hypothetical protein n=1 Tax=Streptomyces sp. NPDC051243 TaxID=3365646 RepID=UPI003798DB97